MFRRGRSRRPNRIVIRRWTGEARNHETARPAQFVISWCRQAGYSRMMVVPPPPLRDNRTIRRIKTMNASTPIAIQTGLRYQTPPP